MRYGAKETSPSIPAATVPVMNIGPDVLVAEIIAEASSFEMVPFAARSAVNLAPHGYPAKKDARSTKMNDGGMEKNLCDNGARKRVSFCTAEDSIRMVETTMKGKSAGNTRSAHRTRAPEAPSMAAPGDSRNKISPAADRIIMAIFIL